ncbi:hypothetical protein [Planktothrix agardhii]
MGVIYDCDPQKVIEILLEIIYKHPETLNQTNYERNCL